METEKWRKHDMLNLTATLNKCLFSLSGLLLLLLTLHGCSSISVDYDFDPRIDFNRYHSYAWDEVTVENDILAGNPLRKKRIVSAADQYLQYRGYEKTFAKSADFLITVHAAVKERREMSNVRFGFFSRYDPWWGSYGGPIEIDTYEEETVIFDFRDRLTGEVIWRGTGKGIPQSGNRQDKDKLQQDIDLAIAQMLNNFPPGRN